MVISLIKIIYASIPYVPHHLCMRGFIACLTPFFYIWHWHSLKSKLKLSTHYRSTRASIFDNIGYEQTNSFWLLKWNPFTYHSPCIVFLTSNIFQELVLIFLWHPNDLIHEASSPCIICNCSSSFNLTCLLNSHQYFSNCHSMCQCDKTYSSSRLVGVNSSFPLSTLCLDII